MKSTPFDYMSAETAHIQTLSTPEDLSELMRTIKRSPRRLVESEGPNGHRPTKLYLHVMSGYALIEETKYLGFTLRCTYGDEDGFILAAIGDTVVTYADGSFCILPTGTSASIKPPLPEAQEF